MRGLVEIYFDGASKPVNPSGIATYGFIVYENSKKVYEEYGLVGAGCLGHDVTNNVAEYTALIRALEWLVEYKESYKRVVIKGDSKLVIMQLRNLYSVRARRIIPLFNRVQELIKGFEEVSFTWIPRELNKEADALSKKAYYDFCEEHRDLVMKYYSKYFITKRQKKYISLLAKKLGIEIELSDFMSKKEASELIKKLLIESSSVSRTIRE